MHPTHPQSIQATGPDAPSLLNHRTRFNRLFPHNARPPPWRGWTKHSAGSRQCPQQDLPQQFYGTGIGLILQPCSQGVASFTTALSPAHPGSPWAPEGLLVLFHRSWHWRASPLPLPLTVLQHRSASFLCLDPWHLQSSHASLSHDGFPGLQSRQQPCGNPLRRHAVRVCVSTAGKNGGSSCVSQSVGPLLISSACMCGSQ